MRALILCFTFLFSLSLSAQRSAEWKGDTLKVSYSLGELYLESMADSETSVISLPGFAPTLEANKPQLLHRSETFAIPYGYEIARIETKIIECDTISVKLGVPTNGMDDPKMVVNPSVSKDIEPYEGIWPNQIQSLGKIQSYRGVEIGRVHIYPISYDYYQEKVLYARHFDVNIIFTPKEIQTFGTYSSDPVFENNMVEHILSISESVREQSAPQFESYAIVIPPAQPDPFPKCPFYIIVCPESLQTEANRLAEWKSSIGYSTMAVTIPNEWINDTDYIKETIRDLYNNYKVEYVVLFGDGDLIPPYSGTHVFVRPDETMQYYTDFFYSCLDRFEDDLPDVYLGRIPVSNLTEAKAVVSKIINYEKNPPISDRYYENNILFSEFDGSNETDASYFIETTNQIYQGIIDKDIYGYSYVPHEIYLAPTSNHKYFKSGKLMPSYLQSYDWAKNPNGFIQEWNKGNYLVGVMGHGEVFGWLNNGFREAHLSQLKSSTELPILLSFNCYSGAFYHPNHRPDQISVCRQLFTRSDGGVVSYIGGNGYTWQPYTCYYFAGMYEALYPGSMPFFNLGTHATIAPVSYPTNYELGRMMEIGRLRTAECFEDVSMYHDYYEANKEVYHLIGDPSIHIHHGKPLVMSPQFVKINGEYYLKDPRRLIFTGEKGGPAYYNDGNKAISVSDLVEYAKKYPNMCLVGDVGKQAYVPEFLSLTQLSQLAGGGSISKVSISNDIANVEVESGLPNIKLNSYDIYGNLIGTMDMVDNQGAVTLIKGVNIITIESEKTVLDTRRVLNH
ncbi:MAG: hypothetical protein HDT05_03150 [Bacteroidales bacterium]|nr:hypothetical protein [Bacteroidales bacterium]